MPKLDSAGRVLASWGGGETWGVALARPIGLALDENRTIYIADRDAGRLLKVRHLLPVLS